jgi:hypothetical protein
MDAENPTQNHLARTGAVLDTLLPFEAILGSWRASGGTPEAAREWTRRQVRALADIVADDGAWEVLLERGASRAQDAWLALDWPLGFDELLLCAPLCRLVSYECARCTIGARQERHSCAHPSSVFGHVGELLQRGDRGGLLRHLRNVLALLDEGSTLEWDLAARAPRAPGAGPGGA